MSPAPASIPHRSLSGRGAAAGLALLLSIASLAAPARADDTEAAQKAYDRGSAAFAQKRWAEAAAELSRADALAPNPVALESALKAALLADDPVLGMALVERAEGRAGLPETITTAAGKARARFGERAGKLLVRCAPSRRCTANVDAEPFPIEQRRWVKAGDHAVEIVVDDRSQRYTVKVDGAMTVEWSAPAPAEPAPPPDKPAAPPPVAQPPVAPPVTPPPAAPPAPLAPPPEPQGGLSPAWFWVGLGLTAAVGGMTIASGVDTLGKHSDFMDGIVDNPTPGQNAQNRTNVLIGVTSAFGLATAGVGLFAVRWSSKAPRASLRIGPGSASLGGHF
ncbi:MAG: hypothetical protein U0359_42215 [Byssovorax sp.]